MDKQKKNYWNVNIKNCEADDISKNNSKNSEGLDEKLYTRKMCKSFFKVSYVTLFNWKKRKVLIPISVGGKVYYRISDIEKLINQNTNL